MSRSFQQHPNHADQETLVHTTKKKGKPGIFEEKPVLKFDPSLLSSSKGGLSVSQNPYPSKQGQAQESTQRLSMRNTLGTSGGQNTRREERNQAFSWDQLRA